MEQLCAAAHIWSDDCHTPNPHKKERVAYVAQTDRYNKSHFSAAPSGAATLENTPGRPGAPSTGRCSLVAMAAPPARSDGLPQRRVARRGEAMRGLDMRLKMG